jgi:hypothetical protein
MTASRDPDQLIHAYFDEGPDELPDPVYDAVRDRIEQTRQRADHGPWRTFLMSRTMQYGLAAAAAVIVAIIGFQLLGGPNVLGPGPSPSVAPSEAGEPTPSAPASAAPSIPAYGSLPEGPFILWDAPGDVAITVTIPGPGWFGDEGGGMLVKNQNADLPTNAGLIVFQGPLYVYGDACHWSTTTPDRPATTMWELIAALEAQTSRDGGDAGEGWNIGGSFGWGANLNVPEDAVFKDCDEGQFRSWVGDPLLDTNVRSHQGPGQVDELWTGDVNGVLVVFDVYYPGPQRDVVDELWIAVDPHGATTFEMP